MSTVTHIVQKTAFQVEDIRVTIVGVENWTTEAIRTYAYNVANETPARCFGANVKVTGNVAVVSIHRD